MKQTDKYQLTKLLAFCAFLLAGVIWILQAFKVNVPILTIIKDIALFVAVALPAHSFAKSLNKIWLYIYYIILAIFIVTFVLGNNVLKIL